MSLTQSPEFGDSGSASYSVLHQLRPRSWSKTLGLRSTAVCGPNNVLLDHEVPLGTSDSRCDDDDVGPKSQEKCRPHSETSSLRAGGIVEIGELTKLEHVLNVLLEADGEGKLSMESVLCLESVIWKFLNRTE